MKKTQMTNEERRKDAICICRTELPALLGCGQATADRISIEAGARIKVGKRVLIKLDKLKDYLDLIAG